MKKKKYIFYIVAFLLVSLFCIWQNNDIVVSRQEYTSAQIPSSLDGYIIVQVSDLHNKQFGGGQKDLLAKIEKEKPDMIVVTGDLVDSNHTDIGKAMDFIKGAVKLAPVYYVSGNHELWLEDSVHEDLINQMQKEGVACLQNQVCNVESNDATFSLIGLDDAYLWDNTLNKLMQEEHIQNFTILLAHEPQYIEKYSETGVDLVFSGHAHGGQVRLPWIGGLVAPDQGIFPKYTAGWYVEGEASMYVSRGLGNSIVPLRLFNRPELVVISLNSEKFAQ